MLLDNRLIRNQNIIVEANQEHYRHAGYDLTVGRMVSKDGKEIKEESYTLAPHGGMVEAISAERVEMPNNVLGYATAKTAVSREAVLALNLGIVDPGYTGLISTMLINFSKQPYVVHKGRPFLRLTFHRIRPDPEDVTTFGLSDAEYVRKEIDKATTHFSDSSFLDIDKVAARSAAGYTRGVFVWFPVVMLFLAASTFIFNFVAPRYTTPPGGTDVRNACEKVIEERLAVFERRLPLPSASVTPGAVAVPVSVAPAHSMAPKSAPAMAPPPPPAGEQKEDVSTPAVKDGGKPK